MGAQPDTSTSAPEVWHGVPQILAPSFVARLLDTYLATADRYIMKIGQALPTGRTCSRRQGAYFFNVPRKRHMLRQPNHRSGVQVAMAATVIKPIIKDKTKAERP